MPAEQMTAADLSKIRAEPVPADAVVVVWHVTGHLEDDQREQLLDAAASVSARGLTVILCEPGQSIETLNEADMARAGWVRAGR
jgi:hypothetical protein